MKILIMAIIMVVSFTAMADNDDWGRSGKNYRALAIGLPGMAVEPPKVIVSPPVIDNRDFHKKDHRRHYWKNRHKGYKHEGKQALFRFQWNLA